jgi:hypothetical protein
MAAKITLKEALARLRRLKPLASEPPVQRTSIQRLAEQQRRVEARMSAAQRLKDSTYRGRGSADSSGPSPDYQGPMNGAGSGTRDRMPGTTPTQDPNPKPKYTKKLKQRPQKDWRNGGFI